FAEERRRGLIHPGRGTSLEAVITTKQTVQVADLAAVQAYAERYPPTVASVELGGVRTHISVPMLKDDELIGAIAIYPQETSPFQDKKIELVKILAAQPPTPMENTGLPNDCHKSPQQHTATADVLGVISSSPGDLEPVFRAMLQNSIRICEAKFGQMFLSDQN